VYFMLKRRTPFNVNFPQRTDAKTAYTSEYTSELSTAARAALLWQERAAAVGNSRSQIRIYAALIICRAHSFGVR
jgi:hypothetical protein